MSFLDQHMKTTEVATSINRCRCYLHLLFLSDMTTADGRQIDHGLLLGKDSTPRMSKYSFPPEFPTKKDWLTWSDLWRQVLGYHLLLPQPLGEWIHESHISWKWFYDAELDQVIEDCGSHMLVFTQQSSGSRITRSGALYTLSRESPLVQNDALIPATCNTVPSFRRKDLHCDFESSVEWFLSSLSHGSLVWVTDGSHSPTSSPNICGAGWIVKDVTTDRRWACSFYEVSESANSYRTELLGLLSIHMFVLALSKYFELLSQSTVKLCCDNKGALRTSSRKLIRIRPTSKCADILRCFRSLHHQLKNVHIHYAHVAAHMDDVLQWEDLTLDQQLNVQCDFLAKRAVSTASKVYQDGQALLSTHLLPLEQSAIFIDGHKLSSDISHPLWMECSRIQAKKFLCSSAGGQRHNSMQWTGRH